MHSRPAPPCCADAPCPCIWHSVAAADTCADTCATCALDRIRLRSHCTPPHTVSQFDLTDKQGYGHFCRSVVLCHSMRCLFRFLCVTTFPEVLLFGWMMVLFATVSLLHVWASATEE